MRFLQSTCFFLGTFMLTSAHMGITVPNRGGVTVPNSHIRDQDALGDPWRYPNNGICSSVTTPSQRATINVGDRLSFPMSFGAPHDGGHCAFFVSLPGENQFWKINDVVDCTLAGSHSVTIPSNVPSACSSGGCTIMWFWTPVSSGTCEIYSDCYDVIIKGASGGIENTVSPISPQTLNCVRVGSDHKTSSYGPWIGDNVNPTPTPTPSSSTNPTPTPSSSSAGPNPTPTPSSSSTKPTPSSSSNPDPTPTPSSSSTKPTPVPSSSSSSQTQICKALAPWNTVPGMVWWCNVNCILGWCPADHCKCDPMALRDARVEYQLTHTLPGLNSAFVYSPQCQRVTAGKSETLMQVANHFETLMTDSAYLSSFACLNGLDVTTLSSTLAVEGTQYYVPGDCLLDSSVNPQGKCSGGANPDANSGVNFHVSSSLLLMLSASFVSSFFF